MKTAKEMFEGIGYKLSEAYSEDTLISYFDGKKNITIEFCIKNKQFRKAKGVFDCVNISIPELKAIQKQCKELGWLEEETCTNESEYDSTEEFRCSNCGFTLVEHKEYAVGEDGGEEYYFNFKPKYCPNCGSKIID